MTNYKKQILKKARDLGNLQVASESGIDVEEVQNFQVGDRTYDFHARFVWNCVYNSQVSSEWKCKVKCTGLDTVWDSTTGYEKITDPKLISHIWEEYLKSGEYKTLSREIRDSKEKEFV